MKTAAAYLRVSTEAQDEYSLDSQLKLIRSYAASHDMVVPDEFVFTDDGISGRSAKKRPEFQRMIGWAKEKKFDLIKEEIKAIKNACGDKILKVIIETCLLSDEEKIEMCKAVTEAGADFIKTSTGFSTAGATREDIKLFSENIGENVKMKAAGGIASLTDAEDFLKLGATRLGTSRIVSIAKSEQGSGY